MTLRCQERDRGIQCPNEAAHSSSLCLIHKQAAERRAGVAAPLAPPQAPTVPKPVDFDENVVTPHCRAATRLNQPCRASARQGRKYCIAHDPEFREQHALRSRAGGIASGQSRSAIAELFDVDVVDLHNRAGVQALIDAVIRLELSGKVPSVRTRTLVRLLALAVRNFDTVPPHARADGIASAHSPSYFDTRNAFDLEIENIALAFQEAEAHDRAGETDQAIQKRRRVLELQRELRHHARSARENLLNQLARMAVG